MAAEDPGLKIEADFRRVIGPFTRLSGVQPIFPDPGADPDDPASYRFQAIDRHIKAARQSGCKILWQASYDVGLSDAWKGFNLGGRPPRDMTLWGRVVTHCLEHFNSGWAGGFRGAVAYAEFVNEPDGLGGFTGPQRERLVPSFIEFLKVVERCNARHPDTPVEAVGPGIPLSWDQWRRFEQPTLRLLQRLREERVRLPIFSFHTYGEDTSPGSNQKLARALRTALDAHGMTQTRLWNSEWQATDFIRKSLGHRPRTGQPLTPEQALLYQRAVAAYALACKIRWQGLVDYSCYYIALRRCFPVGQVPRNLDLGIYFPPASAPTLLAKQDQLLWETARLYPERCQIEFSPDDGMFSALALHSPEGDALLLSNPSATSRTLHISTHLCRPTANPKLHWKILGGTCGTARAQGEGGHCRFDFQVPRAASVLVEFEPRVGKDSL